MKYLAAVIMFAIGIILLAVGGSAIDSDSAIPVIVCVIGVLFMAPTIILARRMEQ